MMQKCFEKLQKIALWNLSLCPALPGGVIENCWHGSTTTHLPVCNGTKNWFNSESLTLVSVCTILPALSTFLALERSFAYFWCCCLLFQGLRDLMANICRTKRDIDSRARAFESMKDLLRCPKILWVILHKRLKTGVKFYSPSLFCFVPVHRTPSMRH